MGSSHPDYGRVMLDIFSGKDPGMILWQPRIDFWYSVNKVRGTLPEHMKDFSLLDLYDYCHASIRYFVDPLRVQYSNHVQITRQDLDEKFYRLTWETPVGSLTEVLHYDDYRLSAYNSEYRLKTADDFRILEYIRQNETWYWDQESYVRDINRIGRLGMAQFYFRRSPVQGLFIENMGFGNAILFMHDYPDVVERYIEVCTEADEGMYAVLCKSPTPMMNFGENIDAYMDPPTIWRKHLIQYYRRRDAQLKAAGKFTHIHIDGAMKRLLHEINESPFDGIEACTPLPQGDVTIAEIKMALGDKVLLDGIPAVYFMDTFSFEDIRSCVGELVDTFYPRLVLGISDELPPNADIERVRMVGEMLQDLI